MLYYNRIYLSEVIDLPKRKTVKKVWFVFIGYHGQMSRSVMI